MGKVIALTTELDATKRAIAALEQADTSSALVFLRNALSRRKPPHRGPDYRSYDILWIRAHIEKAVIELEKGHLVRALRTLHLGLAPRKLCK